MGSAHAALDGVGARHQESLLLPFEIDPPRRFCRSARETRQHGHRAPPVHRLRRVFIMPMSALSDLDPRSLIGTGLVGLLNATGTYDVERYPWAYDFWKRQQQTHWMG